MGLHLDDLDPETKEKLLGKIKIKQKLTKDEVTRASVTVLHTLVGTGLPVSAWAKVLDMAKAWLKGEERG